VPSASRRRLPRRADRALTLIVDGLALGVAAFAADDAYGGSAAGPDLWVLLSVPVFLFSLALSGLYKKSGMRLGIVGTGRAMSRALSTGVVLMLALEAVRSGISGQPVDVVRPCLVGLFAVVLIPPARASCRFMLGWNQPTRAVIVGFGRVAESVRGRLTRCGVDVVGIVDDYPTSDGGTLGSLADLPRLILEHRVDHVIVAFSQTPVEQTLEVLRDVTSSVAVSVVPRMFELLSWRSELTELHGLPLLSVAQAQTSRSARLAKRAFDLWVSLLLLILATPVIAATALSIKLTSSGPVLYRQVRTGRHGKPFVIYKFRTMYVDADERRTALAACNEVDGPLFKMRDDPRITRIGGLLRRTSLDEIPQLFNVVKGDMSLVGPRPFLVVEAAQIDGFAARRFDVPPGITGLWQVSGRSELTYDDLRFLDSLYVSSWSFWWDLRILAQTPRSVLARRGAF
jgi:exopolysaccharide biosynthesis polyprenyl glycosylphosphotransferase